MVGLSESLVYVWFDRSAIEYRDLYLRLYVSYNAWYRKVTGKSSDFESIAVLKTRFIIWDEYNQNLSMPGLRPVIDKIVALTQVSPDSSGTVKEKGLVRDSTDWKGLIDFWYQVRCRLFHGMPNRYDRNDEVQLAYESLYIFMQEVTQRMKNSFILTDRNRLEELQVLTKYSGSKQAVYEDEKRLLQKKFIQSADLWNVDMVRRSNR